MQKGDRDGAVGALREAVRYTPDWFEARSALGSSLPYQLFLAVPYLLALAVLAGGVGRTRSPAALGRRLFVSDGA